MLLFQNHEYFVNFEFLYFLSYQMKNKSYFCIVFKVKISIFSKAVPQIIPTYSKAVPSRTIWRGL